MRGELAPSFATSQILCLLALLVVLKAILPAPACGAWAYLWQARRSLQLILPAGILILLLGSNLSDLSKPAMALRLAHRLAHNRLE